MPWIEPTCFYILNRAKQYQVRYNNKPMVEFEPKQYHKIIYHT